MGNSFLTLSLFIMLLSFFIVMNSVSAFEQTKITPVIGSIEMAFGGKMESEKLAKPEPKPHEIPQDKTGETLEEMQGLFSAHIKDYELGKNRLGTVMTVTMSSDEFESVLSDVDQMRGNADRRGDITRARPFIATLISLIDSSKSKAPYRMDLFVHLPEDELADPNITLIKKAGGYAKSLEDAGLERRLLSAGLKAGSLGDITMIFRRYEPINIVALQEEGA